MPVLGQFASGSKGFGRGNAGFAFRDVVAANMSNYNLNSRAMAAGWDGVTALVADVIVNAGVTISSASVGTPAFNVTAVPVGSTIRVTNNGAIRGKGGNGGAGGTNAGNGAIGGTGGIGLKTTTKIELTNNGTIAGGSGGQGGGAADRTGGTGGIVYYGNCTGGIGCTGSASCYNGFCNTVVGPTGAVGGSTGTTGAVGATGVSRSYGTASSCASGNCGGPSCNGIVSCVTGQPGAGGSPGACVNGNTNITYVVVGTRQGPIN